MTAITSAQVRVRSAWTSERENREQLTMNREKRRMGNSHEGNRGAEGDRIGNW